MSGGLARADLDALYEQCSNAGRWGGDDEQGTLNLITPHKRNRAARLILLGEQVSLARRFSREAAGAAYVHMMTTGRLGPGVSSQDVVAIAPHGFEITHIDALGHVFYHGLSYNGRTAEDVVSVDGLVSSGIDAASGGVFTRGLLLDVAALLGVDGLGPEVAIGREHLDGALARRGLMVEPGDAVLVRANPMPADGGRRAGLGVDAIRWFRDRDVAVYGGDCIEQLPSPVPEVPLPFHMIALGAIGLAIVDNLDTEALREACERFGAFEFAFTVAPPPFPGATGAAVNPLALF